MSATLPPPESPALDHLDPASRTASILERARSAAPATVAPRPSRVHALVRAATHVLRRAHLYAGLLLLPWVFLYGVTGFLFNHPTWFSDQKVTPFGRAELLGTALERLPTAADVAGQVVAALNARGDGGYRLVDPASARYERGGLGATVVAVDGKTYSVIVNADGEGGSVREGAVGGRGGMAAGPAASTKAGGRDGRGAGEPKAEGKGAGRGEGRGGEMRGGRGEGEGRGGRGEGRGGRGEAPGSPLDVRAGLAVASFPLAALEAGLPAVLAKVGLAGATIGEVRAAPLSFLVEGGGQRWLVSYAMPAGSVTARLADPATAGELSTRRFLTAMHMAHGYPATFNARWAWAVIVDVMSGIMVFWGVSGIVMWWQIKRTRRIGAVLLTLSVIAAVCVGVGMHEALAVPGGR